MLKRFLISSVVLLVALLGGYASTLYVSSSGSDSGLGTYESPYQTIAKAVSMVDSSSNTISLLTDFTLDSAVAITGKTLTVDGNGHTINKHSFAITSQSNVTLKNLTIKGSNSANEYSQHECGTKSFLHLNNASITLESGVTIKDANCSSSYGAFYLDCYSTATINDGVVFSNLKSSYGAVRICDGSCLYMNGGEITGCSGSLNEGVAVYIRNASMYMNGGIIHNNIKSGNSTPGGIYLHPNGNANFYMTGGTISENNALTGGAIFMSTPNSIAKNTISISGSSKLVNNVGTGIATGISNIYLAAGQTIDLSGHLKDGAYVGIYSASSATINSDVKVATGANLSDLKYLHSDYQSAAGLVYCDGTKDITADGKVVLCHHEGNHVAGTIWLSEAVAHVHSWQYGLSSDGKSLTAICVNQDHKAACSYQDNNGTTLTMEPLYKGHIDVEIEPHNASASLLWVSANPDVVSVDNDGNVLGLKPGSSVITVTSGDGTEFSDSVTVHVPN